jgi:hypothetical protein
MMWQCRNDIVLQDSAAAVPSKAIQEAEEAAPAEASLEVNPEMIIVCACCLDCTTDPVLL